MRVFISFLLKHKNNYNINLLSYTEIVKEQYDCIIVGVSHDEFKVLNIKALLKNSNSIVFDIKGTYKDQFERL